jgi:polyisoprenoid-binding protein YceI
MRVPIPFLLFGAAAAASLGAAERPLRVDAAHSRIEVAVKATVDSFVGRLDAYEPVILVDDAGTIVSARLGFHFRDLHTGKDSRDRAMHKWQQTEAHPDGLFVLTAIERRDGAEATAAGQLTLHGVTREIRFPVTVRREGARYALDGDATIDTREFGLPGIRMLGLLKVDTRVHVRFHLQAAPDGAGAP